MEALAPYLPIDVSTPKGVVIVNTLAAVVVTAFAVRFWMRRSLLSTPAAARVGSFTMASKDFGDVAETRRDASRTFAAGCIFISTDGAVPALVRPPANVTPGVDSATVAKLMDALASSLKTALDGIEVAETIIARLLPMLTVNPAMDALAAAGEIPMLKQNRFLIRVSAGAVHCLTIGYVGAPPTTPKPDEVLTVASPNLVLAQGAAATDDYIMTYALRGAERAVLDEEIALRPSVAEVPVV